MKVLRREAPFLVGTAAVLVVALAALIFVVLSLTKSPSQTSVTPRARPTQTPEPAPAERLFAPDSVWNAPIAATATVDPASDRMIAALQSEVSSEVADHTGPDIGTAITATMYQVGPNQPTAHVQLSDPTASWRASLQSAFNAVPIPADAQPAANSDAEMTIWQPSTNKLWEFFHTTKDADGWHAAWGGAIENVSRSPGYYTSESWPGALPVWGATATSLPAAAGVITLQDIQRGRINHALALELPDPRAGVWTWPAQRSDGTGTDPNGLPEGSRLRLDPSLNLAALHLPRLTLMIARAAQEYGLIVRDQTHHAIGLYAENPLPLGKNPYSHTWCSGPGRPFRRAMAIRVARSLPVEPPSSPDLTSLRSEWEPVRALIDTQSGRQVCIVRSRAALRIAAPARGAPPSPLRA